MAVLVGFCTSARLGGWMERSGSCCCAGTSQWGLDWIVARCIASYEAVRIETCLTVYMQEAEEQEAARRARGKGEVEKS